VQAEFRVRVLAEIRSAHRVVDKLREKNSQRYMRYTRLAQEKRTKEKLYASKASKDALAVSKTASDKVAAKFLKDTKTYVSALNDKVEAGKTLFHSSLEVRVHSADICFRSTCINPFRCVPLIGAFHRQQVPAEGRQVSVTAAPELRGHLLRAAEGLPAHPRRPQQRSSSGRG
jgi:hypothetical protein